MAHNWRPGKDTEKCKIMYAKSDGCKVSNIKFIITIGLSILSSMLFAQENNLAQAPPMGWNSYNCFGATVTESEVKANADMMAVHLKDFGWEYIVVDYCWSYPFIGALNNPPQTESFEPNLSMDEYGRLLPALDRFPSAANGNGFKPLADYVHSKGLKFGIHVMRGIPRQAVAWKTPVLNASVNAAEIADTSSICRWLDHMYGVDGSRQGAQEYYDSLLQLYAEWGVDYIKVDDMIAPIYHQWEIEAIRKAIDKTNREIVFSLSPGNNVPIIHAKHLQQHSNLWRISADFWDEWPQLKNSLIYVQSGTNSLVRVTGRMLI